MIPRTFHRVWIGPNPMPEAFRRYGESWTDRHPGWEMRLWTEADLGALDLPEAYGHARHDSERSNILRYLVLRARGGVYVDTDFECLKPIDPLLEGLDFFVGESAPGRVGSAIIGAVPGHPILEQATSEARPREGPVYDKAGTGPLFLAAVLGDHPEAKAFGHQVFYPRTEKEREGAYAVHHTGRSWMTHEEMNQRINSLNRKVDRLRARLAAREDKLRRTEAKLTASDRRRKEIIRSARSRPSLRALALDRWRRR